MNNSTMHKINFSKGAARWLAIYLNAPGIFNSTTQVWSAGVLVSSHLQEAYLLKKEITDDAEKFKEWAAAPHEEFEISEIQRDTIKHALGQVAQKGLMVPNEWTVELLEAFGLKPA